MTSPAQAFAALHKLTPAEAVAYLAGRKQITPTYGWQDMWQQEHAQAFTVSRLTRADLLQSLQEQITKSVNGEMSRRDFMRDAKQLLSDAGWWGEKEVTDPVTGEVHTTTFDPARLKLIFDTNTSMAHAAGQWERIQSTKRSHPYIRYISLADDRVRPAHRAWNGVTLPVDDAFWHTHFPPNGWRCRCRVVAVSQRDYDKGTFSSRPNAENDVNAPVVQTPMKKTAPDVVMRDWLDKRSGQVRSIPVGIDPGFGYNPGMARTSAQAAVVKDKLSALSAPLAAAAGKAGLSVPAIAKAIAGQPTWKTLGLPDLRTMSGAAVAAPDMLPGAASAAEALSTVRTALGIEAGGSVKVQTPVEMVVLHDATLPHVVEKRLDERERYANYVLPTLRDPTEVWAIRYDDATLRNRYIKLFSGAKYDVVVIVRVDPDGSIFWNMMPRERKKMNDLRVGERLYGGT